MNDDQAYSLYRDYMGLDVKPKLDNSQMESRINWNKELQVYKQNKE